jgi:hypothetical protein
MNQFLVKKKKERAKCLWSALVGVEAYLPETRARSLTVPGISLLSMFYKFVFFLECFFYLITTIEKSRLLPAIFDCGTAEVGGLGRKSSNSLTKFKYINYFLRLRKHFCRTENIFDRIKY